MKKILALTLLVISSTTIASTGDYEEVSTDVFMTDVKNSPLSFAVSLEPDGIELSFIQTGNCLEGKRAISDFDGQPVHMTASCISPTLIAWNASNNNGRNFIWDVFSEKNSVMVDGNSVSAIGFNASLNILSDRMDENLDRYKKAL